MDPLATLLAFMFFGFITIVLLVIGVKTIRIVPQASVMLVERLDQSFESAQIVGCSRHGVVLPEIQTRSEPRKPRAA